MRSAPVVNRQIRNIGYYFPSDREAGTLIICRNNSSTDAEREAPMNILAVLRMTPDPAGEFEVREDGSGLDREWVDFQLSDFDEQALEEAIFLRVCPRTSCGVA
jgi:hypothetical protein